MRVVFSLVFAVLGCSSPATAPRQAPVPVVPLVTPEVAALAPPQPTLQLPKNFVPTGYTATLTIDPAMPTFTGHIEIAGTIAQRSAVVWLHGKGLTITKATAPGTQLVVTPRGEDLIELRASPPIEAGTWTVTLDYTGTLDPLNNAGAFVQESGGARYVMTQLEAVYARRVFPCVDEPSSKVPWQLTLEVPADMIAIGNTPVVRETTNGARRRFELAKTKPLPSYLVAFGVGPFDVVDAGKSKSGVPVRMFTMRGRGAETAYAAQTTARILDELETWFGVPYPYEKLDMLTIPVTVGFGAMENAGLVTNSENLMLLDPKAPSWLQRRNWVAITAHELAHQWFGNLVTMQWWDDIWLNEGFAQWLGGKITQQMVPEWKEELFGIDTRNRALDADAVITARRVRQPIAASDDIYHAFDTITYRKGASVLEMFEAHVGEDTFRDGVREYVKRHAFGNATSTDFVAAISAAAKQDLAAAFSTFLDQPGAPELSFTCSGDKTSIAIEQRRFVPPGSARPAAQQPWQVPVCVLAGDAKGAMRACTMMTAGTAKLDVACPQWLMANHNGRGLYRVRYTQAQAEALRDLAWPHLSWRERRVVFFDVATAQRVAPKAMPLAVVLSFVPKLLAGGDRFTASDAVDVPRRLSRWVTADLRDAYAKWLRETFGATAKRLGFVPQATDDIHAEMMRADIVGVVAWDGRDPALVKQAVALAKNWRDLPQSIRPTVLTIAADANADVFAKLVRDVKTETDRRRRGEIYAALAAVRDPKRVEAALELTLDPALDIRESSAVLFGTSTEPTRKVAERFVRVNEATLLARLPTESVSGVGTNFAKLFAGSCDAALRDEAKAYAIEHFAKLGGGPRAIDQAFEAMDQCIAMRAELEPEIRRWLSSLSGRPN